MKQKRRLKDMGTLCVGMALGAVLCVSVSAAAAKIIAEPSQNTIYVDGQKVDMDAYKILGSNYLQLREVGEAVGFNVYWDGVNKCVQVDTGAEYTGVAPESKAPTATPEKKPGQTEATDATVDVETAKDEIIRLTNDLRRENGVAELSKDDLLMQAAQVRAEEMAAQSKVTHTRPDGSNYYTVTDVPYMSENLTQIPYHYMEQQNKGLSVSAYTAWENSAGHYKNMLNSGVSRIGIGIAKGIDSYGRDCYYCSQLFLYDGYTVTWVDEPQK